MSEIVPVILLDTSAMRAIGATLRNKNFNLLMQCSQNECIHLKIPEPVIIERADQSYREKYRYPSQLADSSEAKLSMEEALQIEDRKIRILLNNNKAEILPRRAKHERTASQLLGKSIDECNADNTNDYRDALIFSQFMELCEDAQYQDHTIMMVTNDDGLKERVNKYLSDKTELSKRVVMPKNNQKFCEKFLAKYTDLPLDAEDFKESDLHPEAVTEFSKEELHPISSQLNYNLETAQIDIAERLKTAQTHVLAMTYLAFPDTSAETLQQRITGASNINEADTTLAIDSLVSEGIIEDVYGSYSVINEDFAVQAIESLGDNINYLIEALE